MFVFERLQVFGIRPFLRGDFLDLHQAYFLGATSGVGIEATLTPNHSLDQASVNSVTLGGATDRLVLASFQTPLPPPISHPAEHEQQDHKPGDLARLHSFVLRNLLLAIEPVR